MRNDSGEREMFGGVARRHVGRDAAVVGVWLALLVGFLAEVTPPAARIPAEARPAFALAVPVPASVAARRAPARPATRTSANAPAAGERPCGE